jgi:DNA modification methylase
VYRGKDRGREIGGVDMEIPKNEIILGDNREILPTFPDKCVDLVVTSPPYFNSAKKYQRGSGFHYSMDVGEPLYTILDCSSELYRVLKDDGFYCLNLGFSYGETGILRPFYIVERLLRYRFFVVGMICWKKCLAMGTRLFVKHNSEYKIVNIENLVDMLNKDELVLIPSQTIEGKEVWVKVKNVFNMGKRKILKITIRGGITVRCTPSHRFVTRKSVFNIRHPIKRRNCRQIKFKEARELSTSDYLYINANLETELLNGTQDDYDNGFIVGFYLAEGSWIYREYKPFKNNDLSKYSQKALIHRFGKIKPRGIHRRGVQFSCGKKDIDRGYVKKLEKYHININRYGNRVHITNYDDIFELVKLYVTGRHCDTKYLLDLAFNKSKMFLKGIIDGFLAGDGCYEKEARRWRVAIKPNWKLKEQIEMICRIVGYDFRFNSVRNVKETKTGKFYPSMWFSIRTPEGQCRSKQFGMVLNKIKKIEQDGIDVVYNIEVGLIYKGHKTNSQSIKSHLNKYNNLYFLGNGIWTHNSNPIPIKDRLTNSFEYIFVLAKRPNVKYPNPEIGYRHNFFEDNERERMLAVFREKISSLLETGNPLDGIMHLIESLFVKPHETNILNTSIAKSDGDSSAPFPEELPRFCIEVFSKEGDLVIDPFLGSGTTCVVAKKMNRDYIGIEINSLYHEKSINRVKSTQVEVSYSTNIEQKRGVLD